MSGFFLREFDSQQFLFLCQLQTTALGHRGAARCCEGLQGASGAAEGYRGLQEAVGCHEGTPMVPGVTDFTDFCFSSQ
jgi:hypothetical protein